jgi:hypothetical protein
MDLPAHNAAIGRCAVRISMVVPASIAAAVRQSAPHNADFL